MRRASSSSNFEGESEPNGMVIHYYLKNKLENDIKIQVYQGKMLINEISGKGEAGLNQVLWRMDKRRKRTEKEKKQIQAMIKRYSSYGFRSSQDPEYASIPALEGEYTVVLTIDKEIKGKRTAVIKSQ